LDGDDQTQVWMCPRRRMPQLLYWGDTLPLGCDLEALARAAQPPLPHGGLDVEEVPSWLPEPGRGFTDAPGLVLRRGERLLYTQFVLREAVPGAGAWTFTLEDADAGLTLTLQIALHAGSGVFSADVSLCNEGAEALMVDHLATLVLPVPGHFGERLSLGGRWAAEFQAVREPLGAAGWQQESRVGRSSHHAYPGLVLMAPGTDATQGETWGWQLAWSGNHRLLVQHRRLGGWQVQAGELLLPGEVTLQPGEACRAPTLHLARSASGLRALSLRWHRFIRDAVLPPTRGPRRVQFNTWEATYFNHGAERLRALAERAAVLGVERFVLDDGWFADRHDDRAGLGDWVPCPERYPKGLGPLAAHCQALGLQFGLWVEPEGVSPGSALHRAHPSWVMGVPRLVQPLGRHQLVLNLGIAEARDHLFRQLSALLRGAPIDFLKWDMNRDMTHAAGPDGRAAARAHVSGLYRLIDDLRQAFPALEIETCASGGARADLGMLRRCTRVWVSDCNDPVERQRSQRALLHFLPPEVMGVHVGDARSHTTGRVTDMALRTLNGLFGHLGAEADLLSLSTAEADQLAAAIAVYKTERGWLHQAWVTPIDHPDPGLMATQALSTDGRQGLVAIVAVDRPRDAVPAPLRLPGLIPGANYRVHVHLLWRPDPKHAKRSAGLFLAEESLVLPGAALAGHGLALPVMLPGSGWLLQIERLTPLGRAAASGC